MLSGLLRRRTADSARADEMEDAVSQWQRAVDENPRDAVARSNLCSALNSLGFHEAARREGEEARRLAPRLAAAHHNFGLALLGLGRAEEAERALRRARKLAPELPQVASALGHSLRDQGRFDEAMAAYDAALRLDPQCGDALINRASLLLLRGDFARGWEAYAQRFEALGAASRSQDGAPPWRGEPLAGCTILVHGEQGVGDEVMYASCVPDLAAQGAQVLLRCSDRLAPLFARSFAGVEVRGGDAPGGWPRPDFQADIGTLPRYLRRSPDDFPARGGWLVPDAERLERWRGRLGRLGGRARVGISWRGGAPYTRGPLRSIALGELEPLLRLDGVEFVSLQHAGPGMSDDEPGQLRALGVHEFEGVTEDLEELAALICALDLVVSIDNSNVHLAGALGKETWALLPPSPDWRYGWRGDSMLWYASVRLWRRGPREEWGDVVARVAEALERRFAAGD
jgi:tetratricopeptide (TPR) repeat protein